RGFAIRPDKISYGGIFAIDISCNNIQILTLHVGTGDNNVTVFGTAPGTTTTLDPGSGRNTVDLQSGTLNVLGGGAGPGPGFGRYTVAAPATLNFPSGAVTLTPNSSITGAGTVAVSGSASVTGARTHHGTGPTRVAFPSTVNFNAAAATGQLFLAGGVLGGTGDLTVTGTLTWTDGIMQDTGRTVVNGRLEISGPARKTLDARRLENAGQAE